MTEQFDASLARLRSARLPERDLASFPDEDFDSSTESRLPDSGSRNSQLARFAVASAGHLPDLDGDIPLAGKPRLALAPKAALAAVVALLTLGGGVAAAFAWSYYNAEPFPGTEIAAISEAPQNSVSEPQLSGSEIPPGTEAPPPAPVATVVVHVAGEVNAPGIVTLAEGARVADAITGAGGATADAALEAINLARMVTDGEQIKVPKIGEEPVVPDEPATEDLAASNIVGAGGATADSGKININTADAAQLQQLPGIGPALAQRIIAYREENGGFGSIGQLQEVKGIGPAVMSNVQSLITV